MNVILRRIAAAKQGRIRAVCEIEIEGVRRDSDGIQPVTSYFGENIDSQKISIRRWH